MTNLNPDEYIQRWDRNAEKLAARSSRLGDINKEVLITPRILVWLGDIQGKEILDAGCGEGFLCRLMAERGARVTGIDYSGKMLEIARERTPEDLDISYCHANLEDLEGIGSARFDIIGSILALQDIPDYQAALRELHRVLKPGGRFFLAFTHPCFASEGGWIKDESGATLFWKVDRYFDERPVVMKFDPNSDDNPIGFHRTLSSYFSSIQAAGFRILNLIEPYPSQKALEKYPSFKDDLRMCHFIVFDLEKEE